METQGQKFGNSAGMRTRRTCLMEGIQEMATPGQIVRGGLRGQSSGHVTISVGVLIHEADTTRKQLCQCAAPPSGRPLGLTDLTPYSKYLPPPCLLTTCFHQLPSPPASHCLPCCTYRHLPQPQHAPFGSEHQYRVPSACGGQDDGRASRHPRREKCWQEEVRRTEWSLEHFKLRLGQPHLPKNPRTLTPESAPNFGPGVARSQIFWPHGTQLRININLCPLPTESR
jgi:hypothetical protein